jgi:hypothetical protein
MYIVCELRTDEYSREGLMNILVMDWLIFCELRTDEYSCQAKFLRKPFVLVKALFYQNNRSYCEAYCAAYCFM